MRDWHLISMTAPLPSSPRKKRAIWPATVISATAPVWIPRGNAWIPIAPSARWHHRRLLMMPIPSPRLTKHPCVPEMACAGSPPGIGSCKPELPGLIRPGAKTSLRFPVARCQTRQSLLAMSCMEPPAGA